MHLQTVTHEIRKFIVENYFLGQDESTLKDSDSFLEYGILDSTGILQLITFLEETYGIKVQDEDVSPENLDSIDRVAAYLRRNVNGNHAVHAGDVLEAVAGGQA
jgi:acyl carrier protein